MRLVINQVANLWNLYKEALTLRESLFKRTKSLESQGNSDQNMVYRVWPSIPEWETGNPNRMARTPYSWTDDHLLMWLSLRLLTEARVLIGCGCSSRTPMDTYMAESST